MKKAGLLFALAFVGLVETVYQVLWAIPASAAKSPTMKHLLLLMAAIVLGSIGTVYHPIWGVVLYYALALLRPQYLWEWSLPVQWRWSLIAAGIALFGCLLHLPRLVLKGRLNLVLGLMVAYAIILLLSCLTAFDPTTAGQWGIEYAKIILMAFLASIVIDHLWQLRLIGALILGVLGYIAWEINSLYFFDHRLQIFHYGYGGLDNNGAGLMLAMGIPFAYAYGCAAPKHWHKAVSWGLGLLMVHAVLMSYSRGAMLASIIGMGWVLMHHRPRWQAGVIVLAIALVVPTLAGREIRDRFFSTSNYESDGSANSRLDSWAAAWTMAWDRPFLGQGIRNSNQFSHNYGADIAGRTIHSQYLQIAADSGIPAMAIYIGLIVVSFLWLGRARHMCLHPRDDDSPLDRPDPELIQAGAVALACQAALIIFAFGGVFLSLEVFELPWLLMVLAGVFPAVARQHIEHQAAVPATTVPIVPIKAGRRRMLRPRRRILPGIPPTRLPNGLMHP